jgi:hypothetical protein
VERSFTEGGTAAEACDNSRALLFKVPKNSLFLGTQNLQFVAHKIKGLQ